MTDDLSPDERERVAPYVTDVEGPVFALTNLPEVVKGALFARYSRSAKSLRRLLLDEFLPDQQGTGGYAAGPGTAQADALYDRVLAEYGDDSVAQLGGAHVAVEGASNILTKVLEWGRLASYLEQSTRYIRLDDKPGGRYRYYRPADVLSHPDVGPAYVATMDAAFDTYARLLPAMVAYLDSVVPTDPQVPGPARERAIRAQALDALRGLLPAATTANVGIFASGQAYEALLIRMQASPLPEARECAQAMLRELRKVIPAFLTRTDRPDRGGRFARYMEQNASAMAQVTERLSGGAPRTPDGAVVRLVDFDLDGEVRVVAHAMWPDSGRPLEQVRALAEDLAPADHAAVLAAYVGDRADRRERPGRAFEATGYTFEVVCDYGAYRDLQRHRMMTLQAQPLSADLGYDVPDEVVDAGLGDDYRETQDRCAQLYEMLRSSFPEQASYAVTLAHRIRFTMQMNARQAMHLIELRSQPQGHATYRTVAQEMHRLIREEAGHTAIAQAMSFVDRSQPQAGRMAAETRQEHRSAGR